MLQKGSTNMYIPASGDDESSGVSCLLMYVTERPHWLPSILEHFSVASLPGSDQLLYLSN